MKEYVIGVDVGGTTVKLGLFSTSGQLLEKWEIPTCTEQEGKKVLPDIAASIENKLKEKQISHDNVEGIGIGVPGPVDSSNVVHKCINLGWGVLNVKEEMNRLLPDIPKVAAGNDANVAALGELWQGGGQGSRSTVMMTLGTGVGGGVVLDGRIIAGHNGGAGEIGHITVEPQETELCACGKKGCVEQYASANGIVRLAKRMLTQSDEPSALRDMPQFTSKDICELAEQGDPMATAILERCGEYLGRALSCASAVIDPDVFIIGGGMSRAGKVLTDVIQRHYSQYAFHVSAHTRVVTARLGNDAGIYGCAKMIIE
ncbi:MAG: ROK family glucokinase [Oscillospiraceae bacterium]|nr:ROK family glucokinase [Oscillospiraceae bacterium]